MPRCKYCGGNCPNDEDNCCDGYSGDIDGLYKKDTPENKEREQQRRFDAYLRSDAFKFRNIGSYE